MAASKIKIYTLALLTILGGCQAEPEVQRKIINASCAEKSKSSMECGQKQTTVPSDIQLVQQCQGTECESINIRNSIVLFDREGRQFLSMGCREDVAPLDDSRWALHVKKSIYSSTLSFQQTGSSASTCGVFDGNPSEMASICDFIASTMEKKSVSCSTPCGGDVLNYCTTSDPRLIDALVPRNPAPYPRLVVDTQ